ncbi:hypothetical protein Ae201684P_014225 [Aphanomyces euteiches]|nr:hypothetical protein Ae201684P_014225 [Aphanomyces euteiches]
MLDRAASDQDSHAKVRVKLANGQMIVTDRVLITLPTKIGPFDSEETFFVIDLDDRWDLILGMRWLEKHKPTIDWCSKTLSAPSSSDDTPLGVMSNELTPSSDLKTQLNTRSRRTIEESIDDDVFEHNSIQAVSATTEASGELAETGNVSMLYDSVAITARNTARNQVMFQELEGFGISRDGITKIYASHDAKRRRRLMARAAAWSQALAEETVLPARVADTAVRLTADELILSHCDLEELPRIGEEIVKLPEMSFREFKRAIRSGDIVSIALIQPVDELELNTSSTLDTEVTSGKTALSSYMKTWEDLRTNPYYDLLREYEDVFPEEVPETLPKDKGVRHEIDLVPGTKWCVTRQWPLPREQVDHIDAFFEKRRKAGHVRPSTSPHSSPTFCVKKPTGGWCIVHAFNKLNSATIPAQTPIPRKDVIIDGMAGSTIFSTIDLRDGFYQTLMRVCDIPKTAVSTPSGMLWEWLVIPQGLSNAPATFNRLVTGKLRPLRDFAPSYFDDIYVHSKKSKTCTDLEVHRGHLEAVLEVLRESGLYANIQKCMFGVSEIPVLGDYVGINGCRVDPSKVDAINSWPVPRNVTELRSWLGLATYLHKFSENFASIARPLSTLLSKDEPWNWTQDCQAAFDGIKASLVSAPILALPRFDRPFSVVCDASIRGIGCCLMQVDDGRNRPVSFQSRQLRAAERNYPVHDLELLAIKYALVKFRIYLLGSKPFVVYTDHASLRYAVKTPHISERMARWFSFFAEYNMTVEYKPGSENVLADALSRRPANLGPETTELSAVYHVHSDLYDRIRRGYRNDPAMKAIMAQLSETTSRSGPTSTLERYSIRDGLLLHQPTRTTTPRVAVPCDADLRSELVKEFHDTPSGGHLGRDKTHVTLARSFWWPRMFKSVARYIAACDVCQRVKSSPSVRAPLQPLQIPGDLWASVSMDYIFGLPRDNRGNTGIWTCVDRASKYLVALPVKASITAEQSAKLFFDNIYCRFGLPTSIVSDRDPRFTSKFWTALFSLVGSRLNMSTSEHPESDGQTERANRVIEDVLRSYAQSRQKTWSSLLPQVEFAYNSSPNASTGFTPFYANYLRHPRLASSMDNSVSNGGKFSWQTSMHSPVWEPSAGEEELPARTIASVKHFVKVRESILLQVQDNIAEAQSRQSRAANKQGRRTTAFALGDQVLLHYSLVPKAILGNAKTRPQWFGPFPITKVISRTAYRLALPADWQTHDTVYVGKMKAYILQVAPAPELSTAQPHEQLAVQPQAQPNLVDQSLVERVGPRRTTRLPSLQGSSASGAQGLDQKLESSSPRSSARAALSQPQALPQAQALLDRTAPLGLEVDSPGRLDVAKPNDAAAGVAQTARANDYAPMKTRASAARDHADATIVASTQESAIATPYAHILPSDESVRTFAPSPTRMVTRSQSRQLTSSVKRGRAKVITRSRTTA